MTSVKSIDEIKTLLGNIDPLKGRPTFATIRRLEKQLIKGARKIEYRAYKYGFAGDIMDDAPYGLLSVTPWPILTDPGSYLKLDDTERTDGSSNRRTKMEIRRSCMANLHELSNRDSANIRKCH